MFKSSIISLVFFIIITPLIQAKNLEKSMILFLSFDKIEGGKVVDHSQYHNDGEIAGKPQKVKGKFGNALKFNGKTDWITVKHDDSLQVDKGVTVMAWINAERHSGPGGAKWSGILAKSNNPRSYSFYTTTGGGGALHFSSGGGSTSAKKVELNKWQHVVAQHTGKGHIYYVNGELAGEFSGKSALPGKADTAELFVGKTHEGSREFLGLIDEVRVWNRVLSEEEVKKQMTASRLKLLGVAPQQKLTSTWGLIKQE